MLSNEDFKPAWTPDMILFDAGQVYPGASYYTQKVSVSASSSFVALD